MKNESPTFPSIYTPLEADFDGEVIDFGVVEKIDVMQEKPAREYKTQLLIAEETAHEHDYINLDITHFTEHNLYDVSLQAHSKNNFLRKLRKLIKVVRALPAKGIPQPQKARKKGPKMPQQAEPPLMITEGADETP